MSVLTVWVSDYHLIPISMFCVLFGHFTYFMISRERMSHRQIEMVSVLSITDIGESQKMYYNRNLLLLTVYTSNI